jgi:hypothetical protein
MHNEAREVLMVRFKLVILDLASHFGVTKNRKEYHIPRTTFDDWKKKFNREGRPG